MEFFKAMGIGATEGSKRKLEGADVYIGIFAHRYGYIEQGYSISVTEAEFNYAKELGLERLCFLVDEGYPWTPDLIDYDRSKIEEFRKRINSSVIRAKFNTVDNFKLNLIQTLTEWQGRITGSRVIAPTVPLPVAMLPPRPTLLVGRESAIMEIKTRLGVIERGRKHSLTIIQGWPGVGKTTFVNSVVYDPEVCAYFKDGILSSYLGEHAEPHSELVAWQRHLGSQGLEQTANLKKTIEWLRAVLLTKRLLLIVDDAWSADHVIPFKQVAGPNCSLIVTTRFPEVSQNLATEPSEDIYNLGVLSDDTALELLHRLSSNVIQKYPEESRDLVHNLEGLPLAIRVAGRLLDNEDRLGVDVRPLMIEIRDSHLLLGQVAPDDRFDPNSGTTPTIRLLLERSTDKLDNITRERFAMLGAFAPKPATFDTTAIKSLWDINDPMPTIRTLVDRGLLEAIVSLGRFQLHALLVMHAKSLWISE